MGRLAMLKSYPYYFSQTERAEVSQTWSTVVLLQLNSDKSLVESFYSGWRSGETSACYF